MINPQELRIGNYIHGRKGICFKVLPEDIETISKFPNNYNPIPLTEEWLLRFGAREYDKFLCLNRNHLVNEFLIRYIKANQVMELNFRGISFFYLESKVHQLQNLVFALEGVELEIVK